MITFQRIALLADELLDLVLGEQLVTPMELTVKQHPYLMLYYLSRR